MNHVIEDYNQKYSRLRRLLRVKGLGFVFIWAGLAVLFDSEKYNKGSFKVMDTYLQLLYNFEPTFLHLPCLEERAKFL